MTINNTDETIDMLTDGSSWHSFGQHAPTKVYGIFIDGKRMKMFTGTYFWTSKENARRAFIHSYKRFKRRINNSDIPSYSELLANDRIKIKEIGIL